MSDAGGRRKDGRFWCLVLRGIPLSGDLTGGCIGVKLIIYLWRLAVDNGGFFL
ncbi:hypothetical protein SSCH_740059 [Syntrophaceticus schinkii]|uniref:Uncharacterized protein n=1 Tax=Syntrophaceticus schinkii TaxID=499207 RepID=A0A0B7MHT1_9FIRM|nr:hypothetical protein SSCH_740059 [Syntrophaceticus schinkii]